MIFSVTFFFHLHILSSRTFLLLSVAHRYQHNPEHDHYEFGYRRGNEHHFQERYEKAAPHAGHFKTKVWELMHACNWLPLGGSFLSWQILYYSVPRRLCDSSWFITHGQVGQRPLSEVCVYVTCIYIYLYRVCTYIYGPGSLVGIATDYGLDGPGIEPRWSEIFRPSRPTPGTTQPPV